MGATGTMVQYASGLEVDPPRSQSRLSVFFRWLLLIPHIIILRFLQAAANILVIISWFIILITGKLPRSIANFLAGYLQWEVRVDGYGLLLTDSYAPFELGADASYAVKPAISPILEGRNRLTTFFRPLLIIPHAIVLVLLGIGLVFVLVIAWFIALFTTRVPQGLHDYMAGVLRWYLRVETYWMLLTDQYPPFAFR